MRGLLAGTALAVIATLVPPLADPALADQTFNTDQTVDGSGGGTIASPLAVSGSLNVATGTTDTTITVVNGGQVTSGITYLGRSSTSPSTIGAADVSGAGSSWNATTILSIGDTSAGAFTLGDGATLHAHETQLGSYTGSTGALTIATGGQASGDYGYVGYVADSTGIADVSGAGSSWALTSILRVGYAGQGTLNVSDGGSVSADDVYFGDTAGSIGIGTVTGSGSSLSTADDVGVGMAGNGTLTISDGATVSDQHGLIASDGVVSGVGSVTVTGPGSNWTNSAYFDLGTNGTGTLTIADGGNVSVAGPFTMGRVTGSNATLNIGASLGSAPSAPGTLDTPAIALGDGNNAIVFNHTSDSYDFDAALSGTGLVTADGGTTILTADSSGFTGGTRIDGGTLEVTGQLGGAYAIIGGPAYPGAPTGRTGTAIVTGADADWTVSGAPPSFYVGYEGDIGNLTISDGASVTDTAAIVGYTSATGDGTAGSVTVTGAGSSWDNSGGVIIGDLADGRLTISDHGAVTSGGFSRVGEAATGTGNVSVSGAGSSFDTASTLFVGGSGTGRLDVEDGGSVTSADGVVGSHDGSVGMATIRGSGSNWTINGEFDVADSGRGTLTIDNGASLSDGYGYVGAGATGVGSATVTGAGSRWTTANTLEIGDSGQGSVEIVDGGTVEADDGVLVAANSGSTGYLEIGAGLFGSAQAPGTLDTPTIQFGDGRADLIFNHTSSDYEFAPALSGFGYVDVVAGDTTLTGDSSGLSGSVSIVGGSLTVKGRLGGSMSVNGGNALITGPGADWATGTNAYVSEGNLTIDNGGQLSDSEAHIGEPSGKTGTAMVTGSSSKWTSSGQFHIGGLGDGTLTIADGATVEADGGMTIATDGGSSGTLNIGAARGDAAQAPGLLDSASIRFGDGTGRIEFNHTSDDYVFSSDISGLGSIWQSAGKTVLTGDSSTFTGLTTVEGGTLDVNGALGGSLLTGLDGTLMGSGTLGNVVIDGTVAPGNSIGTLTVSSVTFSPGSTYQVEVDSSGNSDRIHSTGTATIDGGTVKLVPYPDVAINTPYTILTADGGVSGAGFDTATYGGASLFLTPTLSSDADNVYLSLRQTADFDTAASTPNERAAAGGAQSLGGGPLYGAIATLGDAGDARTAFDAISGEVHASARSALIVDSHFLRDAALARLAGTPGPGQALWGYAYGGFGHEAGDGNAAALDTRSGGLVVGADGALQDGLRLGLLAGYGRQGLDVTDRASSGRATHADLGVYGAATNANFALRFGGVYSFDWLDISRTAAFPGFSDALTSAYTGSTAQVFGQLAYSIGTDRARVEPFAGLAHVRHATNGFSETGGPAALTGQGNVINATFATLGLRGSAALPLGQALKAKVTGMIGWQHGLGDMTPDATLAFSGGAPFTVSGTPIARDSALVRAGIDLPISRTGDLNLDYSGRFGGGTSAHSFKASLDVQF